MSFSLRALSLCWPSAWALSLTPALTACGGGGSGGSGGAGGNGSAGSAPTGDAVSFSPTTLSATAMAGEAKQLMLTATVKRPADFANATSVYAVIKDSTGVISTDVQLGQISTTSYQVILQTSPTVAFGRYSGNFSVMLCRDPACSAQFPGSPVALPFDITISAPPLGATASGNTDPTVNAGKLEPATASIAVTGPGLKWTASSKAGWIKLNPASGTGPATVNLSYHAEGLAPGLYTDTVQISTADGQSKSVPVSLGVAPHKLVALETGVAFTATPGWSRLSRSIPIRDNLGGSVAWTAQSDQPWLDVTPSGATGGALSLSARPESLPADTISYATVTLRSSAPSISRAETIRVALWKGSATPSAVAAFDQAYQRLIADPLRPYVYAHAGESAIDVYHLYTGRRLGSLSAPGAAFRTMAVAPDGGRLYAHDNNAGVVQVFDLASFARVDSWPAYKDNGIDEPARDMIVARPDGVQVLMIGGGGAWVAATGKRLDSGYIDASLSATADGRLLYTQNTGFSPSTVEAYRMAFRDVGDGALSLGKQPYDIFSPKVRSRSNGQDIAITPDGSRLYIANGSPYRCGMLDTATLEDSGSLAGGSAYPNNIKVASDGRVYCGISGVYEPDDVWVHRPDGSIQASFKLASWARNILTGQMVVSGDGMMLIAITNDPRLVLVPVGP